MGTSRICLWLALQTAAAACASGGERSPEAARSQPTGGAASSPEDKLRAAQETALAALCERLVDCSVESAHASMSPEEVAKLDLKNTAPRLVAQCEAEGAQSNWSPRQVRVVQHCVVEAGTCDALQTCLAEAKKRPE
jgi:hypothetical protein